MPPVSASVFQRSAAGREPAFALRRQPLALSQPQHPEQQKQQWGRTLLDGGDDDWGWDESMLLAEVRGPGVESSYLSLQLRQHAVGLRQWAHQFSAALLSPLAVVHLLAHPYLQVTALEQEALQRNQEQRQQQPALRTAEPTGGLEAPPAERRAPVFVSRALKQQQQQQRPPGSRGRMAQAGAAASDAIEESDSESGQHAQSFVHISAGAGAGAAAQPTRRGMVPQFAPRRAVAAADGAPPSGTLEQLPAAEGGPGEGGGGSQGDTSAEVVAGEGAAAASAGGGKRKRTLPLQDRRPAPSGSTGREGAEDGEGRAGPTHELVIDWAAAAALRPSVLLRQECWGGCRGPRVEPQLESSAAGAPSTAGARGTSAAAGHISRPYLLLLFTTHPSP